MGLILIGVSKSSKVVAMPAASSLRVGITTLYRRADLAPAVLIIAGISFLVHVLITINIAPQDAAQTFRSVTLAARTSCDACMAYENQAPILILQQPKAPFAVMWAIGKHYD